MAGPAKVKALREHVIFSLVLPMGLIARKALLGLQVFECIPAQDEGL